MSPGVVAALVPLVVVVSVVAAALSATRRPACVRLTISDGALHVEFLGWDAVWLLRRRIVVPVGQVRGLTVARQDRVPREGRKLPGANVPGVIRAGVWVARPNRDVWDVRRAEHVLWIELEPDADFRRFVLEVPDPHAAALELRPALGSFVPDPD